MVKDTGEEWGWPGYTVVNMKYYESGGSESLTPMFAKEYEQADLPTMILRNVPWYMPKKEAVKAMFKKFGVITKIERGEEVGRDVPPRHWEDYVAYVQFKTKGALNRSLEYLQETEVMSCEGLGVYCPVGVERLAEEYNSQLVSDKQLLEIHNKIMEDYDTKKAEEEQQKKEEVGAMDEDGFQMVVHAKKKTSGFAYTERNQKRALSRKQQKRKQLEFFSYGSQARESKRAKIEELQRKYKEDQEKIEKMRQSRKYKPF